MSKDISIEVLKYLDFDNGFYIECGAHDGIFMSNTYRLEKEKNWGGILVEPSPVAFHACCENRDLNKNLIINVAIVSPKYGKKTVLGDFFGHPMSSIGGRRRSDPNNATMEVPAITITNLFKSCDVGNIDFFSLDVEGYEMDVLEGMDFNLYRPTYFLIEENKDIYQNLFEFMDRAGYEYTADLSQYNKIDDPKWSGNHNDYLFKVRE